MHGGLPLVKQKTKTVYSCFTLGVFNGLAGGRPSCGAGKPQNYF
jgi:hypothetical protein